MEGREGVYEELIKVRVLLRSIEELLVAEVKPTTATKKKRTKKSTKATEANNIAPPLAIAPAAAPIAAAPIAAAPIAAAPIAAAPIAAAPIAAAPIAAAPIAAAPIAGSVALHPDTLACLAAKGKTQEDLEAKIAESKCLLTDFISMPIANQTQFINQLL